MVSRWLEPSSRKLFGPHALPIKDGSPLDAYIDPDTIAARFIAAIEGGHARKASPAPRHNLPATARLTSRDVGRRRSAKKV
jgi:hypothetical protein